MNREQYFKELTAVLKREGFTPLPERNSRIPVEWMGRPLCRIAEDAEIRYRREDVDSAGAERACAEAMDLASTVLEYMEAMERAPLLRASGLHEDFHLLADFGGAVLAGRERENGQGYQFVTWVWDYDRQGVVTAITTKEIFRAPSGTSLSAPASSPGPSSSPRRSSQSCTGPRTICWRRARSRRTRS